MQQYHFRGGGLFIFAENDPHHAHANAALSAIYGTAGARVGGDELPVHGNAPGTRFVHTRLSAQWGAGATAQPPVGNGTVVSDDHLALTGIVVLYEGQTVAGVHLPSGGGGAGSSRLEPVVTGGYRHGESGAVTIIAADGGQFSQTGGRVRGRVVVDTGFTKLWKEWEKGATARWVTNATTWLLGVDARIALGQSDAALRQPPAPPTQPAAALLPMAVVFAPPDVLADVIFVVDVSGSMEDHALKMQEWAREQAKLFDKQNVRSGLIFFDHRSFVRTDPAYFRSFQEKSELPREFGGTTYKPALEATTAMLRRLHEVRG